MDGWTTGSGPGAAGDDVAPTEALDRYVDPRARRGGSRRTPLLVACLVLLLVGGGAVVLAQRANRRVDGPALMPASPIDGKATKRHPVRVTPDTGLVDGQQVTVTGSEFPPNADIGVVMCTNAAASIGVDACDISTSSFLAGQQIHTTAEGTFTLEYTVRTHFRIKDPNAPVPPATAVAPTGVESFTPGKEGPGDGVHCEAVDGGAERCWTTASVAPVDPLAGTMEVDCLTGNVDPAQWAARVAEQGEQEAVATDPGSFTCLVAAGVISDYDESGGWPVAFAGEVFLPPPTAPTTDTTAATATTTPPADAPSTTDPGTVTVTTADPATGTPSLPPVPSSSPTTAPVVTIDPSAPDCAPVTIAGQVSGPSIPDGCIPQPGGSPP